MYSFRLIDPRHDLEPTSRLLRSVFPKARHLTPAYLRWQYAQNPLGIAVGCNAYLGDELVGTMAAVPMAGALDGHTARGLFMLNGAVHPHHRGKKLQSNISAAIFEEAASRGYDFCFGTGNKYSTGPLLTRFRFLKPLEARIGLGLPSRKQGNGKASFVRIWTPAEMRWRLANPERAYKVGKTADRSVVTARTGVPGLAAVLYDGAEEWPQNSGNDASLSRPHLWIGLDPDVDWPRSAYAPIPHRLRRSPLNLVFKDLTGGSYLPDPNRVRFRAADFDPF